MLLPILVNPFEHEKKPDKMDYCPIILKMGSYFFCPQ